MIYLDTSVLVAYYVPEPLSDLAQQRLLAASVVIVSELAQTEFLTRWHCGYALAICH